MTTHQIVEATKIELWRSAQSISATAPQSQHPCKHPKTTLCSSSNFLFTMQARAYIIVDSRVPEEWMDELAKRVFIPLFGICMHILIYTFFQWTFNLCTLLFITSFYSDIGKCIFNFDMFTTIILGRIHYLLI